MTEQSISPLPEIENAEIRHIPGFPGYAVTDDGRVFSCKRVGRIPGFSMTWRLMKPTPSPPIGYLKITLTKQGSKNRNLYVHRLVLETFVGRCPPYKEACHNNGDCTDNRLQNLRWDTRLNNIREKQEHGSERQGENHHSAKLTKTNVQAIRQAVNSGTSLTELALQYNVHTETIRAIVTKRSWKHV